LKHVPGTKIGKTDELSRQPDWKVGVENNNDNQIFIKKTRSKDKEVVRVVEKMKKAGVKVLQGDK